MKKLIERILQINVDYYKISSISGDNADSIYTNKEFTKDIVRMLRLIIFIIELRLT